MNIEEFIKIGKRTYNDSTYKTYIDETTQWFDELIERDDICSILDKYDIKDEEFYTLLMLYARCSKSVQRDLFYGVENDFIREFKTLFNGLLQKTPRTHLNVLYRKESASTKEYINCFEQNKPFVTRHYLTCSKDDFDNSSEKLVIKPLSDGKSKAHEVFQILNNPEDSDLPEWQVNFERGTKFKITDVKREEDKITVYLQELE